jgi:hypothetical protein
MARVKMPTVDEATKKAAVTAILKNRTAAGQQAPHVPTDKDRNFVMLGRACGLTDKQTAELVGISESTLRRHYAEELEHGAVRINMMVASNIFRTATQRQDLKAANTAGFFWLKSRAGWNDRGTTEVGIESLGPVRVTLKIGDREPSTG